MQKRCRGFQTEPTQLDLPIDLPEEYEDPTKEKRVRTRIVWLTVAIILALAALMFSTAKAPAQAYLPEEHTEEHMKSHAMYHEYYKYWYNMRGTHCCEEQHCSEVETRWNKEAEQWEAKILGHWQLMNDPGERVKDNHGLNIASACYDASGYVFCFQPPMMAF